MIRESDLGGRQDYLLSWVVDLSSPDQAAWSFASGGSKFNAALRKKGKERPQFEVNGS
jgi:hypothetical protein